MRRILMNLALLSTIGLMGCSTNSQNENTGIGAVTGAAVGGIGAGVLGGNGVAIGASIIGGALLGGFMGHSMDSTDNTTSNTVIKNNSTNQTTSWVNRKTGVAYTMTPTSDLFTVHGNPNCRKFYITATKNGKSKDYNGTACLMNDGNWHTIKR